MAKFIIKDKVYDTAKMNFMGEEKIRQTLRKYPKYFKNEDRGVWSIA